MKIHVFGNSHVWIFNGDEEHFPPRKQVLPHFLTYHLGPTTAWSWTEKYLPQVQQLIRKHRIPKSSKIMFVVGEVDCRWHLPFQAKNHGRDVEDVVRECMDRYFESFKKMTAQGFEMYAWGTHPTTTAGHCDDPQGPIFGTVQERNRISVIWNQMLKDKCKANGIKYVSIYRHMVDENNITKMEYMRDYCHMANNCIPLILKEFGLC